jgi:hypothetical protein
VRCQEQREVVTFLLREQEREREGTFGEISRARERSS